MTVSRFHPSRPLPVLLLPVFSGPLASLAGSAHMHVDDISVLHPELRGSHIWQNQLPIKSKQRRTFIPIATLELAMLND